MSIADAIVDTGLDKLGYRFVNLDDCWSASTRDETGQLQPNATRFPEGMKALADYVHSKGLKLGLYTCTGTYTCKNKLPGSAGHWQQDADTLANWGVDFVKADYCSADKSIPSQELYQTFSSALNATGREMLFSLCQWGVEDVAEWGGQVGQMFRIQMDHIPFWHYPPNAAGVGFGQGTSDIIEFVATLKPSSFVTRYGWLDPDFLETLFPITMNFVESRTEFTFWALWSAPLIVATDLRNMTAEKQAILTNPEVIAIDQDALATGGDRISGDNVTGAQVWYKPLQNGDAAIVLYNHNPRETLKVAVAWSDLPATWGPSNSTQFKYPPGASGSVRDLWNRQNLGVFALGYSAMVPPKDVVFMRVMWVAGESLELTAE